MSHNTQPNIWQTDIQDWTKVEPDSATFYISQAEARLKETVDTYNLTSTRTENYIVLITAIMTGAVGYMFTGETPYLQAVSAFVIIQTVIAIYYLANNLTQYTVYTVGDEPKAIYSSLFVDPYTGKQQYLHLVYYTMRSLQYKIDENTRTNRKRTKNTANARIALLCLPIAFFLGIIYQYCCGYQLIWFHPD